MAPKENIRMLKQDAKRNTVGFASGGMPARMIGTKPNDAASYKSRFETMGLDKGAGSLATSDRSSSKGSLCEAAQAFALKAQRLGENAGFGGSRVPLVSDPGRTMEQMMDKFVNSKLAGDQQAKDAREQAKAAKLQAKEDKKAKRKAGKEKKTKKDKRKKKDKKTQKKHKKGKKSKGKEKKKKKKASSSSSDSSSSQSGSFSGESSSADGASGDKAKANEDSAQASCHGSIAMTAVSKILQAAACNSDDGRHSNRGSSARRSEECTPDKVARDKEKRRRVDD